MAETQRPAKIIDVNSVTYLYAKLKSNIDQFQDSSKTAIDQFKSDAQTSIDSAVLLANNATSDAQAAANNANQLVKDANGLFLSKVDAQNTYLRQSSAAEIYQTQSGAANTYLSKTDASNTYVPNSAYNNKVSDLEKADTDNLSIAKSYAETQASNALNSAKSYVNDSVGKITSFEISVVSQLPSAGKKGTIYLISASDGSGDDVYNEYIWIPSTSKFEKIGTTRIDLTPYAKAAEVANTYLSKTDASNTYLGKGATADNATKWNGYINDIATANSSDTWLLVARENSIQHRLATDFATSGHTHNYAGSSSAGGAANSAVKLATARNIALGNALSGSANFDGSGNITISAKVNKGTTAPSSLAEGSVFFVYE